MAEKQSSSKSRKTSKPPKAQYDIIENIQTHGEILPDLQRFNKYLDEAKHEEIKSCLGTVEKYKEHREELIHGLQNIMWEVTIPLTQQNSKIIQKHKRKLGVVEESVKKMRKDCETLKKLKKICSDRQAVLDFIKAFEIINPVLRNISTDDHLILTFFAPRGINSLPRHEDSDITPEKLTEQIRPEERPLPMHVSDQKVHNNKSLLEPQETKLINDLISENEMLGKQVSIFQKQLRSKYEAEWKLEMQHQSVKDKRSEDNKRISEELQKVRMENEQLFERNQFLQHKVNDLTDRLSKEMGDKMMADESSVENVSVFCRPINIAETFYNFCSNTWLDAKNTLDENYDGDEKNSLMFLDSILEIAEVEARALMDKFSGQLVMFLEAPQTMKNIGSEALKKSCNLPKEFSTLISEHLKRTSRDVDLTYVQKNVEREVQRDATFGDFVHYPDVKQYIKEATSIAWSMVIQRPPMTFKSPGKKKPWDDNTQEPYWRCDPNKKSSVVQYYIHPCLYHGEHLMVKGKVFIG